MRALTELGIPHRSTLAPGHGEVCVFPSVTDQRTAFSTLSGAGWAVQATGPRSILVTAPPLTFRQHHPAVRILVWAVTVILGCAFWFISIPLIVIAVCCVAKDHPWLAYFYVRRHRSRRPAHTRHGRTRRF